MILKIGGSNRCSSWGGLAFTKTISQISNEEAIIKLVNPTQLKCQAVTGVPGWDDQSGSPPPIANAGYRVQVYRLPDRACGPCASGSKS